MKKQLTIASLLLATLTVAAETKTVSSPDGRLQVTITDEGGRATYTVGYDGQQVLLPSLLGFEADFSNFTEGLTITGAETKKISSTYQMRQTKRSTADYNANCIDVTFRNAKQQTMGVTFQVSNNDVAFRYVIPRPKKDNPKCAVVSRETTSFRLPDGTTTFLTPQITPMTGWERTKPSYEEDYVADAPMATKSKFGQGYTFPCLFKASSGAEGAVWVLISETGVDGSYVGSHLSDFDPQSGYTIAFPQQGENNGIGSGRHPPALRYAVAHHHRRHDAEAHRRDYRRLRRGQAEVQAVDRVWHWPLHLVVAHLAGREHQLQRPEAVR